MSDRSSDDSGESGQRSDGGGDRRETRVERLVMAVSVVFTLLLFAYVSWQAVTTPSAAEPSAAVTGTEQLTTGQVAVTVTLRNEQDIGLVSATVVVDCGTPPPEITFEHVPTAGRRIGTVVCPAGTTAPNATVSAWIEA